MPADLPLWSLLAAAAAVTYLMRFTGVIFGGRIRPDGALIEWINAVAVSIAVGLGVKVLLWPAGELAATPLLYRAIALAAAFAVLFASGRNLFFGLLGGVLTLALLLAAF